VNPYKVFNRLIIVFCLLITFSVKSQNFRVENIPSANTKVDSGYSYYEALSLRLYYEQKWDSLLMTGREAIDKGYDYFYMQVRTGAAGYYLGKYALAARYLENAKKLNSSDEFTNELLFMSYLYTGRDNHAALLTGKMPPQRGEMLYRSYIKPSLYLEFGPVITNGRQSAKHYKETDSVNFSEKYADDKAIYSVVGWKQPVNHRLSVNTAISYLDFNKYREDKIRFVDSLTGNYKVSQYEFYLSPSFTINRRWSLSLAGRMTSTRLTEPIVSQDSVVNLYLGNPIAGTWHDFVAGGEVLYSSNYWKLSAGGWYLSINDKKSWQGSASVVLLPRGNLDLYTITTLTYRDRATQPFIFTQRAGTKVYKRSWLEVSGTFGNIAGTTEYNGQLFNNQVNKAEYRLSSLFFADVSSRLRIMVRYQFIRNVSDIYFLDAGYILQKDAYNFNSHTITGGITWFVL